MIEFEQASYEVREDIGDGNFALRVCLLIANLSSERSVRVTTMSGTAQSKLMQPP